MGVIIESTTSSEAELQHASQDGEAWRTPPQLEETKVEAPAPVSEQSEEEETPDMPEGETAEASDTSETNEEEEGKKPSGRRGRYQRKIDRLVSRVSELETQLQEASKAAPRVARQEPTAEPQPTGKPKMDAFGSMEEYVAALVKWERETAEKKVVEQAEAEQRGVLDKEYNTRAIELQAEHGDYNKTVGREDLRIPPAVVAAVKEMGSEGPDIAYYLGKHPEVCEELCELRPFAAVQRIGQIAKEIKPKEPSEPQIPKTRSTPPPPVRGVAGSSRTSIPLDSPQISDGDYVRIRNAELRAKGRR